MARKNHYLKPNRLADVIALLQVLALQDRTHPSLIELNDNMQGNLVSCGSWAIVAEEHPEFFRFNKEKHDVKGPEGHTVSLSARHVIRKNTEDIPEFPLDLLTKLIDTVIELHDKQRERANRWKTWLPFFAIILTVLATIYVSNHQQSDKAEIQLKGAKYIIIKGGASP